jgi:hypothetical protein
MIQELVARIFERRNQAHAQHWKTKSYAQHVALGEYYDDIISALDKFVESYQGALGKVDDIADGNDSVIKAIKADLAWITQHREAVASNVPVLENLLDELAAVHTKALYKLENRR